MNRFPVENVDKVNSAKVADKATSDSNGSNIVSTYLKLLGTYIKNLSISGKNITVTHDDGTTSTLTTQDTTYSLPTGNASTIGGLKLSDSTSSTSSTTGGIAATPNAVKSAYDLANTTKNNSITGLSVSGKTITYTKGDGTTGTITTQDTTYSAATTSALGLVKIGSNITISSGTISLTKSNVTTALGYTPPTTNTTYSTGTENTAGLTKLYTSTGTSTDGTMTRAAITSALSNVNVDITQNLIASGEDTALTSGDKTFTITVKKWIPAILHISSTTDNAATSIAISNSIFISGTSFCSKSKQPFYFIPNNTTCTVTVSCDYRSGYSYDLYQV